MNVATLLSRQKLRPLAADTRPSLLVGATFGAGSLLVATLDRPINLWAIVALTHAATPFILRGARIAGWTFTWRLLASVWVLMTVRNTISLALDTNGLYHGRVAEFNVLIGVAAAGLSWLAVRAFASPHLSHPLTRRPMLAAGASILVAFTAGGFFDAYLNTQRSGPGLEFLVTACVGLWLIAAWPIGHLIRQFLRSGRAAEALVLAGILGAGLANLAFGLGDLLGAGSFTPQFIPVAVSLPFIAAAVAHPSASLIGRPQPGFASPHLGAARHQLAPFALVAVSLTAIFRGAPPYTLVAAGIVAALLVLTAAMNLGIGPLASWWPWRNHTLLARDIIGALVNRDVLVKLEPLTRINDDRPVGSRVTLQWRHPRYGNVDHDTIRRTVASASLSSVLDFTTAQWAVAHLPALLGEIDADEPLLVIPLSRSSLRHADVVNVLLGAPSSIDSLVLDGLVIELDEAPWLEDTPQLFALQNSGVCCMCPMPSRGSMRLQDPDFIAIDIDAFRDLSRRTISGLSSAARLVITGVTSPEDLAQVGAPYTALFTSSRALRPVASQRSESRLGNPIGVDR